MIFELRKEVLVNFGERIYDFQKKVSINAKRISQNRTAGIIVN
jgi:hypothetical protein